MNVRYTGVAGPTSFRRSDPCFVEGVQDAWAGAHGMAAGAGGARNRVNLTEFATMWYTRSSWVRVSAWSFVAPQQRLPKEYPACWLDLTQRQRWACAEGAHDFLPVFVAVLFDSVIVCRVRM